MVLEFFLWLGDRIHGDDGGVFRRQHFRWSVQSSSRRGHLRSGAIVLAEYLDLSPGRFCRAAVAASAFTVLSPDDIEDIVIDQMRAINRKSKGRQCDLLPRPVNREPLVYRPDVTLPAAREGSYIKWILWR